MLQRFAFTLVCLAVISAPAAAVPIAYSALLSGPNESPANASPATGTALVTIDATAHTMNVQVLFQGLTAGNTASHIHVINGPADTNTSDTIGPVATTTPTFPGFPTGATSGSYVNTLDMTLTNSYQAGFLSAAGSITAAEAALFSGIASGRAYLNIHTTNFPGGEIRGFLQPVPEPATLLLMSAGLAGFAFVRRRRRMS